jgi:hypothetical protein
MKQRKHKKKRKIVVSWAATHVWIVWGGTSARAKRWIGFTIASPSIAPVWSDYGTRTFYSVVVHYFHSWVHFEWVFGSHFLESGFYMFYCFISYWLFFFALFFLFSCLLFSTSVGVSNDQWFTGLKMSSKQW